MFVWHAMLAGNIDSYHFIPLSLTSNLPGGHKVSTKQNLGFIFSHTFHLIRMKFDAVEEQFQLNILGCKDHCKDFTGGGGGGGW